MFKAVQEDPDNIVQGSAQGFAKVLSENYAFITDETLILRNVSDNCRLSPISEKFYKSGFGLAFPKGWPYKE